jgi:hypothetical protein
VRNADFLRVLHTAVGSPAAGNYTKLVVIGIGHDHPIDIALAGVDASRPKGDEAIYFRTLIEVVGRTQNSLPSGSASTT